MTPTDKTNHLDVVRYSWNDFLNLRNIQDMCFSCHGTGVRTYGSGSTWRGGISGQVITTGICDICWGSGDTSNKWLNLKELERKTK